MSDESLHRNRKLKEEEKLLLKAMLKNASEKIETDIENCVVQDMNDGGMGSIRFVSFVNEKGRCFGKEILEAQYIDADNVQVSITINIDERGGLFEIDFWKVDFSPLLQYPKPEQLKLIKQPS